MNAYRKILPLLGKAFEAARAKDEDGALLFNTFEEYAATLVSNITLDEAKAWIAKEIRKLFAQGLTAEQIQDHERIQVILMYAGNSDKIEDADQIEDYITEQLGLNQF